MRAWLTPRLVFAWQTVCGFLLGVALHKICREWLLERRKTARWPFMDVPVESHRDQAPGVKEVCTACDKLEAEVEELDAKFEAFHEY